MAIIKSVSTLLAVCLFVSPVGASDDPTIEGLQSDVHVTKTKADQNAQDINRLKGGLPAVEERVAALEADLGTAESAIDQLQSDLEAAIATISQLRSDLLAEVSAREAGDNQIDAAYMAADGDLQVQITALTPVNISALAERLSDVEETLTCVTYDAVTYDLIFVGCNVHVRDGSGSTQATTGLGNMIIGYNADSTTLLNRTGSHNLIIGNDQAYPEIGQLLTKDIVSSGDLSVLVAGDLEETVNGSRRTVLGLDSLIEVGRDIQTTVGRSLLLGVTGSLDVNANDIGITSSNLFDVASHVATISSDGNMEIAGSANVTVKAASTLALKGAVITQN